MTKKIKNLMFYTPTLSFCIFILLNPYQSAYYCKKALEMCANSVVPSLFTFIVLSKIISGYTCSYTNISKKGITDRLFCLPKVLIPTALLGLFFGAPSGAVSVCDTYKKGLCTKKQAEAAITLCNNASAAFIMSIAASVLQSTRLAFLLLASNILTTLTVYFLLFRSGQVYLEKTSITQNKEKIRFSNLICYCVKDGAVSTVTLCGYIVLFYTLSGIIQDKVHQALQHSISQSNMSNIRALISSFFEMSQGTLSCSLCEGNIKIILCCACIAFCGLSIIFQVTSVMSEAGLSSKNYLLSKIASAFLCPLFMLLFMFLIPEKTVSVSNFIPLHTEGISSKSLVTGIFILAIFAFGVHILSFVDKSNKNN